MTIELPTPESREAEHWIELLTTHLNIEYPFTSTEVNKTIARSIMSSMLSRLGIYYNAKRY